MGFSWEGKYYVERVFSFGLRTAPITFNLFAEAWEWIIQSYLRWQLVSHFLDDTMAAFSTTQKNFLPQMKEDFSLLCKILGILENDEKDEEGTLIKLLGRLVDSTSFTVSIPQDKVQQVIALTANALNKKSITLHKAQSLVGLVTFCASAVQLGFVFCRRLWSFVASYKPEWNKAYRRRVPAPV
jgi:hypothetical protein